MKRTISPMIPLVLLGVLLLTALYFINTDSLPGAKASPGSTTDSSLAAERPTAAPRAESELNPESGCTREDAPASSGGCCGDAAARERDPDGSPTDSHCK